MNNKQTLERFSGIVHIVIAFHVLEAGILQAYFISLLLPGSACTTSTLQKP